mmetsp:Transcript_28551/g.85584  ORF Transcript_28551/g.85584 Transcript_28551/m.85584 type:complete len:204 (-) Transcript_28551:84-695(-)
MKSIPLQIAPTRGAALPARPARRRPRPGPPDTGVSPTRRASTARSRTRRTRVAPRTSARRSAIHQLISASRTSVSLLPAGARSRSASRCAASQPSSESVTLGELVKGSHTATPPPCHGGRLSLGFGGAVSTTEEQENGGHRAFVPDRRVMIDAGFRIRDYGCDCVVHDVIGGVVHQQIHISLCARVDLIICPPLVVHHTLRVT